MNSLMVQNKATISGKGKGIHFLHMPSVCTNTCREKVRKEKMLLYRKSKSRFLKDRQRVKKGFKQDNGKWGFKEKGVGFLSRTQHAAVSQSVWKSLTRTFMRNGAKLRYQKILRKALLSL